VKLIWGHSQAQKTTEKEAVEYHYHNTTCPRASVRSAESERHPK
jgi:hypothetical protein